MAATALLAEDIEWESPQQIGLWTDAWMRFRRNRLAVGSLAFVLLLITLAVIAPLLERFGLLQDPTAQDVVNNYLGPTTWVPERRTTFSERTTWVETSCRRSSSGHRCPCRSASWCRRSCL